MPASDGNQHIVIIGTGFAGLGMAIRLKQAGIDDFTVLERAATVGGVWRDNRYPGVACDVESHLYSFSFEPNPDWTRTYAPQREILAYLARCAGKYDVLRHVRFETEATAATYDDATGLWTVETSRGEPLVCRVLVSGAGHALTRPIYPDLPGRARFLGKQMHSARWDESYDVTAKRIAVVGTGASAIQIVPSIAPLVEKLHVLQRTPAWIIPREDAPIPPSARARFRRYPLLQRLARWRQYLAHEARAYGFVENPGFMKLAVRLATAHLEAQVPDPALRARLTPNYTFGCKRILLSDDFYPAMCRDNVELVTDPLAEIRERSIVTKDGTERPVDAIVYATGFEAADASPPFAIRGRGGRDLVALWKERGIAAYLACTISGFPNLFLLLGPNAGLGHSSMVFMIESQLSYVLDAVRTMREKGLRSVDVKRDVEVRFNEALEKRMAGTVWQQGGCHSWYQNAEGRNTVLWPGWTWQFRRRTRRFDWASYDVEG